MPAGTPGYKRLQGLTLEQQNALDLLIQGKSDQATADPSRTAFLTPKTRQALQALLQDPYGLESTLPNNPKSPPASPES